MRAQNGREAALEALRRMRRAGTYSSDAVDAVVREAALEPREAAFCTRLVRETLQNLYFIDYYLNFWSNTPAKRLEPAVLDILRISACQLLFMDRVPAPAAVNEGVGLCTKAGCRRASGLVNSVLRRVAEHRDRLPEIPGAGTVEYLATRYSHELWQVQELIERRGYEGAEAVLAANNTEPPLTVQTNTLRCTAEELLERFAKQGLEAETGLSDCEIVLRNAGRADLLPGFAEGLFYVQDTAAKLAVLASGVRPGMKVLDCCAAPGGKSFGAAILMQGRGEIISCDLQEKKLRRIDEGTRRLGLGCITTRAMDARCPEPELLGSMDVVIADAPCSGLGVIRKKPEIRFKRKAELEALPGIQLDILRGASGCVRPGGTLLYSTCTTRKCENEDVVAAFLSGNGDFTVSEQRTLWPDTDGTDGFFICRMERSI